MTAEDAELAVEHGADGDRRLEPRRHGSSTASIATLDALPEVVETVDGRRRS